jgi:hypothetical protein
MSSGGIGGVWSEPCCSNGIRAPIPITSGTGAINVDAMRPVDDVADETLRVIALGS